MPEKTNNCNKKNPIMWKRSGKQALECMEVEEEFE